MRFRPEIAAIFLALSVMSFGTGVIAPVLSSIRDEFAISFSTLGLLLTMASGARLLMILPAGYLVDRSSPRIIFTGALGALAIGSGLAALAPSFGVLLAGMFIAGAGGAIVFTGGFAHVARQAGAGRRGTDMTRLMGGVQVGTMIGPAAGGLVASAFGWRAAFVLAAVVGLAAMVVVWAAIRTPAAQHEKPLAKRSALLGFRGGRGLLAVFALTTLIWSGTYALKNVALPLYGSEALGFDPAGVGVFVSLGAGVRLVVLLFAGGLTDRLGPRAVFVPALSLPLVGALLLILPPGVLLYTLFAVLPSLGAVATALPPVLVADRVPKEQVGRSLAAMMLTADLVMVGVAPAIGFVLDVAGFWLIGAVIAGLHAVAIVFGLRVITGTPRVPRAPQTADSAVVAHSESRGA